MLEIFLQTHIVQFNEKENESKASEVSSEIINMPFAMW